MALRKIALGIATFAAGAAALTVGAVALANRRDTDDTPPDAPPQPLPGEQANGPAAHDVAAPTGLEGHAAPDLAADAAPGARAPEAFRPDIDAPMTPAEREALRPAIGPVPSMVSPEGTGFAAAGERG